MADTVIKGTDAEVTKETVTASAGQVGLNDHIPGQATTVTATAEASNGIGRGNFVMPEIDRQLYNFSSGDTPLMNLALARVKRVVVNSPEVDHYMIDEPRYMVVVKTASGSTSSTDKPSQSLLKLDNKDQKLPRPYSTLRVCGVNGYDENGTATPGRDLMLFVTGHDATTGDPIVRAVNGPKADTSADDTTYVPTIAAGTKCVICSNAMYETQKRVDPDAIVPQPMRVYLQKRGMNQVVSDYFESQKKQLPFSKALIAEAAIRNFKVKGNRTYWGGRKSKFKVDTKLGPQYVYTCEGLRDQFKRELQAPARWTYEAVIAIAKMFYTGEDIPDEGIILGGNNFIEGIQTLDFSNHPEVQITQTTNPMGWSVTRFHTVFGNFDVKHEPTLDYLGWSNSAAVIDPTKLVRYVRSSEHSFNEQVQDEEARVNGIIVWDCLTLKGSCHIWIDGENKANSYGTCYELYNLATEPTNKASGKIYYLLQDCAGINAAAKKGQLWTYDGTNWKEYSGTISFA